MTCQNLLGLHALEKTNCQWNVLEYVKYKCTVHILGYTLG